MKTQYYKRVDAAKSIPHIGQKVRELQDIQVAIFCTHELSFEYPLEVLADLMVKQKFYEFHFINHSCCQFTWCLVSKKFLALKDIDRSVWAANKTGSFVETGLLIDIIRFLISKKAFHKASQVAAKIPNEYLKLHWTKHCSSFLGKKA